MIELRKIDYETGNMVKCWFQIKSYEEAIKVMLRHCFNRKEPVHCKNKWNGIDHWTDGRYGLWGTFDNEMRFEFDDEYGPSTEFIFEIKMV